MASRRRSWKTITPHRAKGIFCLEGDWYGVKDSTTVEPVLQVLRSYSGLAVPYVHRNVGTVEQFWYYVEKWSTRTFASYPILYLGFHGDPGTLYMGDGLAREGAVSLEEIGDKLAGRCRDQVIHFGSCATLDVPEARLHAFMEKTECVALCGYQRDIDWIDTVPLEVLLLTQFQRLSLTRRGLRAVRERVEDQALGLVRALDFKLVIRPA